LIESIRPHRFISAFRFGTDVANELGIMGDDDKAKDPPMLGAPTGMRSAVFEVDGEDFLVIAYELGDPVVPDSLTPAERTVALGIVRGRSMADIAKDRGTSLRTVANQIQSIYEKLGVTSRLELVARLRAERSEGEE
jgi:DNA-binding CsgD family transcriptional regulator